MGQNNENRAANTKCPNPLAKCPQPKSDKRPDTNS